MYKKLHGIMELHVASGKWYFIGGVHETYNEASQYAMNRASLGWNCPTRVVGVWRKLKG